MEPTEVIEDLRAGLARVIERAHLEAGAGAPAHMVAVYVELEARHALAGHGRASNGVDCSECALSRGSWSSVSPSASTAL